MKPVVCTAAHCRLSIILGLVLICTGCLPVLPREGGRVQIPPGSSLSLAASGVLNEKHAISHTAEGTYTVQADRDDETRWTISRYDDSLRVVSSFPFTVHEDASVKAFFRCGDRLILLSERKDSDSMVISARSFAMTAQPDPQEVVLLGMSADSLINSGILVGVASDSSRFVVQTMLYLINQSLELRAAVYDRHLTVGVRATVPFTVPTRPVATGVLNDGTVYVVRPTDDARLRLHRFDGSGKAAELVLDIADGKDNPAVIQGAGVIEGDKDRWRLAAVIHQGKEPVKNTLLVYSCNWTIGTSEKLVDYTIPNNDGIASDDDDDDEFSEQFRLQNIFATKSGMVLWLESMANATTAVEGVSYSGRQTNYSYARTHHVGPLLVLAIDNNGNRIWQQRIGRQFSWYHSSQEAYSSVSVLNDTVRVLYTGCDPDYEKQFGRHHTYIKTVAFDGATGTGTAERHILDLSRYANWAGKDVCWTTSTTVLIPCYEQDRHGTRLLRISAR